MNWKALFKAVSVTAMIVACVMLFTLMACTEQQRTKTFGGKMTVDLPKNQKLINVTWKTTKADIGLWYLTRPMRAGEEAETYTFKEDSQWGVFEGTVTIREQK
jgi:uncharacterized lipoprotein YehR (DUF1307 family)